MTDTTLLALAIIEGALLLAAIGCTLYALKLHSGMEKELNELRRKVRTYERNKRNEN